MKIKECYGWWADRTAFDNVCETCDVNKSCKENWRESGGRMGGFFDKANESRNRQTQ